MIRSAIEALITALLAFFFKRKDDQQQRTDDRADGARDAAVETQEAINEIADKREAQPPPAADPAALVRELRERAAADRAAGGGKPKD